MRFDISQAAKYLAIAQDCATPKNETLAEHRKHCEAKPGNCPFAKELKKQDDADALNENGESMSAKPDAEHEDDVKRTTPNSVEWFFTELYRPDVHEIRENDIIHLKEMKNDRRTDSGSHGKRLASEGVQRAIAEIIAARRTGQAVRCTGSTAGWEPGREITEIAKRNGCFISVNDFKNLIANNYYKPDFVGGEHQVWKSKDKKSVVKLNGFFAAAERGDEPIDVFKRYLLHNREFKNCTYELLGFTELDRTPYLVIRQPFIANAREAKQNEIDAYLTSHGYESTGSTTWKNGDGIVLADVVSNNVLVNDRGDVFVIDANLIDTNGNNATGHSTDYLFDD